MESSQAKCPVPWGLVGVLALTLPGYVALLLWWQWGWRLTVNLDW
jgi:hypothetical protein